jgi:antitoxin (DNA-binding transcriptional repressor) of toxin-antitoxin stability system
MKVKKSFVAVKELRTNLDTYIKAVERGASFTVLRRLKPVFRIEPLRAENTGKSGGSWETVVDFTKLNKRGVPARDVLKALRAMRE